MAAFPSGGSKLARMAIEPPPGLAPPAGLVPMAKLSAKVDSAARKCEQDAQITAPIPVSLIGSHVDEKAFASYKTWRDLSSCVGKAVDAKSNEEDSLSEASVTRMPSTESRRSLGLPEELSIAPSIGSFGHPEMCSRPCVYFTWGPCPKGSYCGFCHLAHREPIGKLDKRQRKIFQKLGEAEMIALLLPHLFERAKRFQREVDANEVLEVLVQRLKEHTPTGDAIHSITARKVDKLGYVLKQMPFQALVSLIFARTDFDAQFLDELTVATAQLRAKMPAATNDEGSSLLWV